MKPSRSFISLMLSSTLFLLALPRIAYSMPGMDHSAPGADHEAPSTDQSMPGMDESAPGADHEAPSTDQSMPGMDHSAPSDPSAPEMNAEMDHHGSMSLGPVDESFDLRFLDAMILHHEGAVRMAEEALEKSDRLSVRQLARQMIRSQGREIARMKRWRDNWYPDAAEEPVMYSAEQQQTVSMPDQMRDVMMMNIDLGAGDDEFDLRFINGMVPHHEGAVAMAGEALQKSDRPDIRRLSQNILGQQQQEIAQMRTWRDQWY
jgi:uncharacterized protein (DUF305 family)